MPNAVSTSSIVLPKSVSKAIATQLKDTSTIAALSPAEPAIFADKSYTIFNGNSEAEVVAEGAAKGYTNPVPTAVPAILTTIQTTTRVSKQLQWADEDNQIEIIKAIQADQSAAMGRALDYIVYHALNPKSATAISGYTALTNATGVNKVALGAVIGSATDKQMVDSIDNMAELVNDLHEINGIALSKKYANRLRKVRVANTQARLFTEIPLSLAVGNLEGIPAACSGTVNARLANSGAGNDVLAIMGDFSLIRWGLVRDMMAEVIEFGDPDGQGDLKRYNQVAYRTEAVLCHAVIDPTGFCWLKNAASLS